MAKVFTKKQLVAAVSKETGIAQTKIVEIYESTQKVTKKQLKLGYKVKTQNGQIKIVTRKARKGINPQTGKKISIPACKKPKFSFSKEFKKGF